MQIESDNRYGSEKEITPRKCATQKSNKKRIESLPRHRRLFASSSVFSMTSSGYCLCVDSNATAPLCPSDCA